jgi:hypothetical protein
MPKKILVRDVPEDVYEALTRIAERERRSVTKQILVMLEQAAGAEQERAGQAAA